ncbi:HdeD family acid-resistance protein [Xanthobacter variabilis]|uniref:HdeD family acid-resistance protein n=1 Tax=Xanthobacter variabilis TaxID=3119932 RepID=UPI00372C8F7E
MVQLAFILVGAQALRRRWWGLLIVALALFALALVILADLVDGTVSLATNLFGYVFLFEGLLGLLIGIASPSPTGRLFTILRSLVLMVLGGLIIDLPLHNEMAVAILFGLAFAVDGVARIVSSVMVRFPRWRTMAAIGAAEIVLAVLVVTDWPLPHRLNVPVCVSLLLLVSGGVILRTALMLRNHLDEVAILALPLFGVRNWYDNAPVLVSDEGAPPSRPQHHDQPMTVRVWTPVGSADVRGRRLLIDRYIAAVDTDGHISTGHSALELTPDLYISHYPAQEIESGSADFARRLRASAENDVRGRFQPSYAQEAANWCEADQRVDFFTYDARRLRAYWAGYRQDDTYNLTNRNCSVAVAAALDSALEGALSARLPWMRLGLLLLNPDLWAAAYIRSRAGAMSWTPGLVLDYARTLKRIVEPNAPSFVIRLGDFLRRLRAARASVTQESMP